ncbi:MAG: DNA repair protein RadC [Myxococcota bacterium]
MLKLFVHNDGIYRPATADEVMEAARMYASEKLRRSKLLESPSDSQDFLMAKLANLEHEVFAAIWLDNRHRVIAFEEIFRGTIDGTSVYPREIVKSALKHNAAAVVFSHNHPSGIAEPSRADEAITQRLVSALTLVDIRVLDHIVVGADSCVSLAARGLL